LNGVQKSSSFKKRINHSDTAAVALVSVLERLLWLKTLRANSSAFTETVKAEFFI
jgi:hypothetical protein